MLSEEALILIAVVGAVALLVLGVLEILWPSRPRHPVRRSPASPVKATAPPKPTTLPKAAPPPNPPRIPKPVAPPQPAAAPAAQKEPAPVRKRRSKVSPHARPHARGTVPAAPAEPRAAAIIRPAQPEVVALPPSPSDAATVVSIPSPEPEPPVVAAAAEPAQMESAPVAARQDAEAPVAAAADAPRQLDPLLVETCFSLYQEHCYAEVISLGEDALAKVRRESPAPDDAHEIAALWSVVALAKQATGDDEGARVALQEALDVAPEDERPMYRQHLAALARNAAQTLLASAHSHETDDRVGALRAALRWVERGLEAAPADARLREAGETARGALWPAYEQTVGRLLQRQEFETARRLLREALDDPSLPAARVGDFQELFSGTFGGEIGQLTAQAIRSMQEERESEALASLQRAEELLAAISAEALPPKRREEVDQRLWWGYTRLGVRRVEAGEYEEALDPLVHALRFANISPDRQAETRAALVRALEGVADVRALGIRQLNDEGDRDEAVLRTEALRELLRTCRELGLSEEELSVAFARTGRLLAELGMEDRA
jgi:tetratricopeptide (TPR) repeat protein